MTKHLDRSASKGSRNCSELVKEVVEGGDAFFETLSLSDSGNEFSGLGSFFFRVSVHDFPMIEHALWEGTARGGCSESLGETEGLSDWQVCLHVDEWSSRDWLFSNDNTSTLGEALVDSTDGIIWALDFNQEDWLLESWACGKLTSVEHTTSGWNDLTTTSVDSIGVEGHIVDVEADTSHLLLRHNSFSSCPLEGSLGGILDFLQVLDGLGHINEEIWTGGIRTEAPDFLCIIGVPFIGFLQDLTTDLLILFV